MYDKLQGLRKDSHFLCNSLLKHDIKQATNIDVRQFVLRLSEKCTYL